MMFDLAFNLGCMHLLNTQICKNDYMLLFVKYVNKTK